MLVKRRQFIFFVTAVATLVLPGTASANLLQSSHFRLDPNVANTFGGSGSSASYKLTDSGGEAVVGAGASGSYKLAQGYVASLQHSIQLTILPSGTFASWPLDTGTGLQAYDVSMTGDNGVLQNAPTWGAGKIGQALTFNGTSQYVSTATTQTNPNTFTLEAWFKTTTATGGRLVGFGNAQTGASTSLDRHLYMTNGGQIVFGVTSGTNRTISTVAAYNDGAWHHVAATLGANGMTLLLDGTRAATDGTTTTGGSYTGTWRMGYDNLTGWPSAPTSSFYAGSLDEVRVYTRQLSDTEVKGNYTAGIVGIRSAHPLPNVASGSSVTYASDAIVRTDAGGYNLFIQAPKLLTHTDGTTTIPMTTGSIASPTTWTEGTTKGLGFTVTSGTSLDPKWGTGPYSYAGVPTTSTAFYSRTGLNGGAPEKTSLQFRADTSATQKNGTYTTSVVYSATLKP